MIQTRVDSLTPRDIWEVGYEIVEDDETDYFRFRPRFEAFESGLCDTPEEAIAECRKHLSLSQVEDR